jgi:hypothetical protein
MGRWLVIWLVASTTVAYVGRATALGGLVADSVAAGGVGITPCDPDGFTVAHTLSGTTVTDVEVGDIHADCEAGELSITLIDLSDSVIGTGGPITVPASGGSVTVSVSPTPEQADIDEHHLRVVGP